MHKVKVNRGYKKDGSNTKAKVVFATFRMGLDAERYAEQLKKENPKWDVEVTSKQSRAAK
jgi:hypothetical protein